MGRAGGRDRCERADRPARQDRRSQVLHAQGELPAATLSAWREVEYSVNNTIVPGPNLAWACALHPDAAPADALTKLWRQIEIACRLDQPDPHGAWHRRFAALRRRAGALTDLRLDAVRCVGPGTDLFVDPLGVDGLVRLTRPAVVGGCLEWGFAAPAGACAAAPSGPHFRDTRRPAALESDESGAIGALLAHSARSARRVAR